MARLYADEDVPSQVVRELRRRGHDVLTALEAGQANRAVPDPDVLAFATAETRCVLTMNRRDFERLHRANPNHQGIITCARDPDFVALAARVHAAAAAVVPLASELIRVTRAGHSQAAPPIVPPARVEERNAANAEDR